MNIKVLGPGCPNCEKLEQLVQSVVRDMGIDATITKVKTMSEIMQYKILMTPGLVINEQVVCAGRVPASGELRELIDKARESGA